MADKISIGCPGCGANYKLSPSTVGKRVKCPKCGEAFTVELAPPPVEEVVEELEDALEDFDELVEPEAAPQAPEPERPARRGAGRARQGGRRAAPAEKPARAGREPRGRKAPAAGGGGNKGVLIGGGLAVVAVVVVAVVLLMGGGPSKEYQAAQAWLQGKTGQAQVEGWLKLAGIAGAGEWGTAAQAAAAAWKEADRLAGELPAKKATVDFLFEQATAFVGGPHARHAKGWLERAVAKAKAIAEPADRIPVLRRLVTRLTGLDKPEGAAALAGRLDGDIFTAAMKLDGQARVEALAALADRTRETNKELATDCWQRILTFSPDHEAAHLGLGHLKVPADDPVKEFAGKWLSSITQQRRYKAKKEELAKVQAVADKEKNRWKRNRFAKKCRKLRDEMLKEIPIKKWHFYFDDEFVKKPYLLAVEESVSPTTESIARNQGFALSGLVRNFYKRYDGLLELNKLNKPRGVWVFRSKESYRKFYEWSVKKGNSAYPNPRGIGGFFSGNRERMYLWFSDKNNPTMDLTAIMFHEGTHQLMHYNKNSPGPQIGNSPWLQEGLAEFFGGYYSRYTPDGKGKEYRNGKFMPNRYDMLAQLVGEDGKIGRLMPLKAMMNLGYDRFRAMQWGRQRNPFVVGLIYAEGWAFIHFCNHFIKNGKKGYYRKNFEEYLRREVEGSANGEKFAKIFGLKSDRDWENLQKEFCRYLMDSDTGMRHYKYESEGRSPSYWPPED